MSGVTIGGTDRVDATSTMAIYTRATGSEACVRAKALPFSKAGKDMWACGSPIADTDRVHPGAPMEPSTLACLYRIRSMGKASCSFQMDI